MQEIAKYIDETSPGSEFLYQNFTYLSFNYAYIYDSVYESYRTKEFLYNIKFEPIQLSELKDAKKDKDTLLFPNAKDITPLFYEGFGFILKK